VPRKPLSEAAKKAFGRSRKLYWIRKKIRLQEAGLEITASYDPAYRRGQTREPKAENDPLVEPFGEEEFEREMKIRWKRDD
jgi:hypothetical protein